ncbi:MAG: DUF5615 family PIN-like protein [Actinomycetota bacterium]
MRVLLDEHLPLDLAAELIGHDVTTVRAQGWTGMKNGELLATAASAGFGHTAHERPRDRVPGRYADQ